MISGKDLKVARELAKEADISTAEALNILIQKERNLILKQAFVIRSDDKNPTGLEAIALALGYK